MPSEQERVARRERIVAEIRQYDEGLAHSQRKGGGAVAGYLSGAIREEIVKRGEAVVHVEDIVAGVLVVAQEQQRTLDEVSGRQAGAVRDLHEIRNEVGALHSLVGNAERSRAEYARERNEADAMRDANIALIASEVRSLSGAVGELYETQGRLLVELAHRARRDSVHEEEITGVKTAIVKADAKADTALSTAVKAQAKQVGLKAAGWTLGVALFEALRWLMAATGKG